MRGLAVERSLLTLQAAPDLDAVRTIPTCRLASDSTEWNVEVPDTAQISFIPQQESATDGSMSFKRTTPWLLITKVSAVITQGPRR